MAKWYIGTMGFSYSDWSGPFYPTELPARNYLTYYSRIFGAVEVDSTFYGTPRAGVVERWAASTPEGFQFCLKTPRAITHDLALVGAQSLMHEFLSTVRLLEDRLGVILLQFPPSFHADSLLILAQFLIELPRDLRFAVEFRHPSWYTAGDAVPQLLAEHGVCWAATEYPDLPRRVTRTAPFLYVRWIGQHGSFKSHRYERLDRSEQLQEWKALLVEELDTVEAVYGFFNNDYSGFAPATANRFKRLMGMPVEEITPPQQGRLF